MKATSLSHQDFYVCHANTQRRFTYITSGVTFLMSSHGHLSSFWAKLKKKTNQKDCFGQQLQLFVLQSTGQDFFFGQYFTPDQEELVAEAGIQSPGDGLSGQQALVAERPPQSTRRRGTVWTALARGTWHCWGQQHTKNTLLSLVQTPQQQPCQCHGRVTYHGVPGIGVVATGLAFWAAFSSSVISSSFGSSRKKQVWGSGNDSWLIISYRVTNLFYWNHADKQLTMTLHHA